MKRRIFPLVPAFLLWLTCSTAQAAPKSPATEPGNPIAAYFFLSGDLLAFVEEKSYAASHLTPNQMYILKDGKSQPVSVDTPIGLKITPVVTEAFVELDDFDFSLTNERAARKEVRLLSELSYSRSMSDGEIGDIRSINPDIQDQELISQEQEFREKMERQIDDLRMLEDNWADTLNLTFTLTPNQTMSDVYVVCGLSYDQDKESADKIKKGSRMVVHFLGDLQKGGAKTFRFLKHLDRFAPENPECELFFFKGKAEPVAHTSARKLRPLNAEEAAQVRNLLGKVLSN